MDKKWEIRKVSTPERIFSKISEEMPRPVSILLFGADCEFKKEVVKDLQNGLLDMKVFHGAPSTHELCDLIHDGPISLFLLSSMESYDHELRHEAVKAMRRIGAATVVGIYVRADESQPLPARGFIGRPDLQLMKTTVRKLAQHPPTADGLDYLLEVQKEG